jgi:hypothetical protein
MEVGEDGEQEAYLQSFGSCVGRLKVGRQIRRMMEGGRDDFTFSRILKPIKL